MSKKTFLFLMAYVIASILAFFFLLPLWWMISTSLKTNEQIFIFPPSWYPDPVKFSNYKEALNKINFFRHFRNTLYVTIMTLVGVFFSAPLAAYSFSRLKWKGRDFWFFTILSTMMLPPQVTMIPLYMLFSRIGWVDSFKPLYIRFYFGPPYFIFLLRQYFMTIPTSFDDAAYIDGCSPYRIYWSILLPLVKPALITVAIFVFLNTWNDFINPLLYLHSPNLYTLAIALQVFKGQYEVDWSYLMAISTLMTIPVLIVFFFLQRYFIRGIVLSGIKG